MSHGIVSNFIFVVEEEMSDLPLQALLLTVMLVSVSESL